MYKMKNEFLTGIEQIDEEHAKLFKYANEAYFLLKDKFSSDKYDEIKNILEELKDYTKIHFSNEETYMESIQYDRIDIQKEQHIQFIEKLEDFEFIDIDENQEEVIYEMLEFLNDWLISHILKEDKLIK
ncbi:MAG: bacteriohemerythrin [Lachnospiraceae bacterium]